MDGTPVQEEMFIDRNYNNFDIFIDFLRTKKFCLKSFSKAELDQLVLEADYYGFNTITEAISSMLKEVDFVNMTGTSPKYSTAGTYILADLKTRDLNTGVCVQSPYTIIIEFNMEHEFEKIEVGGYNGNTSVWGATNGASAKILTSKDKVTWTDVGILPSNFGGNIIFVNLKKSTAKYIKFQHTSYVGLGFLKIIRN